MHHELRLYACCACEAGNDCKALRPPANQQELAIPQASIMLGAPDVLCHECYTGDASSAELFSFV
jgi:hypothetical protein